MASLTTDEKSRIEQQIDAEIPLADKAAKINQGWDTAFKISIFIMGIMIVIVSALAASNILQTSMNICGAILGGTTITVTAFVAQFNFAQRQSTYTTKVLALKNLKTSLIANPEREEVLARLDRIRGWNDTTPPY